MLTNEDVERVKRHAASLVDAAQNDALDGFNRKRSTVPEIMRAIAARFDTLADAEDALIGGALRIEQLEARLERERNH